MLSLLCWLGLVVPSPTDPLPPKGQKDGYATAEVVYLKDQEDENESEEEVEDMTARFSLSTSLHRPPLCSACPFIPSVLFGPCLPLQPCPAPPGTRPGCA